MRIALLCVLLLCVLLLCIGCDSDRSCEATVSTGTVVICAVVADDAPSRVRGLIGSEPLGSDDGLLLEFPAEDRICISNAEVDFAIDAIFIDDEKTVVAVEPFEARQPGSVCHEDTRYVLETKRGSASNAVVGSSVTISR